MFVILEGADCVGKTTVAREMTKDLKWDLVHHTKPDVSLNYYRTALRELRPRTVYDRCHLSELVYGIICTETRHRVTLQEMIQLNRFIRFLGGVVVVLYDSNEAALVERVKESRDEMFDMRTVLAANSTYAGLAHGIPTLGRDAVSFVHDVKGGDSWPTKKDWNSWAVRAMVQTTLLEIDSEPGSKYPFGRVHAGA